MFPVVIIEEESYGAKLWYNKSEFNDLYFLKELRDSVVDEYKNYLKIDEELFEDFFRMLAL